MACHFFLGVVSTTASVLGECCTDPELMTTAQTSATLVLDLSLLVGAAFACRDHPSRVFYYRVANSPQWKRICMHEVDWTAVARGDTIKRMKVRGAVPGGVCCRCH